MGARCSSLFLLVVAICILLGVVAMADSTVNQSSSAGLFWSTAAKEEEGEADDLLPKQPESSQQDSSSSDYDYDDSDGGFSSLDGMLHWAIGHSDPAKLKQTSIQVQQGLSPNDLNNRQLELQELMQRLKMPSDSQLMQIAIDDLNNASLSLEDRHRALQELLILVESIDNANDLEKLGGLAVIIRELDSSDPEVRISSSWILGISSQNNPVVQKQILELGALAKLMKIVKSNSVDAAVKALYAISALVRNNLDGQELFYAEAGDMMLQDIMSNSSIDIRLRRKAVFLVGDLVECQFEATNRKELPYFGNGLFLKSVVDLTELRNLDLQEKALTTIKNLLQLKTTEAVVLKDFCGLDKALERMRQQLEQFMVEEYQRDYVMEVESLRREVELIFHRKLGKERMVPT